MADQTAPTVMVVDDHPIWRDAVARDLAEGGFNVVATADGVAAAFEGIVIALKSGAQGSFTVRKMSFGQGVERIFPFNSKVIDKVEKIRSARVRRSKLFYLRGLRGKAARLKELERK